MGMPMRPNDVLPTTPAAATDSPTTPPTHSEDGVDLTLIRWMLSLTPLERLLVLQKSVESIQRLRDGQFSA
jgi:hypothetical protein